MVHQYKNNGYNMVLDVASGSVHVVDDLTYEVIALYEDHTLEESSKNYHPGMRKMSKNLMEKLQN